MRKNRTVFLLGAGAALDWENAPTTNVLTKKFIENGFKNGKGEFITQKIFDRLNNGNNPDYVKFNFESIINILEDFVEFWTHDPLENSNGLSFFVNFKNGWEEFLPNYEEKNKNKNSYDLILEGVDDSILSKLRNIPNALKPERKVFETLIIYLLDIIIGQISKYSYHTSGNSVIFKESNKEINELAQSLFSERKNSIQRIYTLNYDSIIENIFNKMDIPFSDGFQNIPKGVESSFRHLTPSTIYDDFQNKNCIYHLHGSAFWDIIGEDSNGLDYYNFIQTPFPNLPYNIDRISEIQLERGKSILIQNIITGYKKVLRTGLSPFRQFFSVFDMDCYKANKLIIIGYSFGDEHVNDIINKARAANQNLIIEIVDPNFDFKRFSMNHLRKWFWIREFMEKDEIDEYTTYYRQANLYAYRCGFKDYIKKVTKSSINPPA